MLLRLLLLLLYYLINFSQAQLINIDYQKLKSSQLLTFHTKLNDKQYYYKIRDNSELPIDEETDSALQYIFSDINIDKVKENKLRSDKRQKHQTIIDESINGFQNEQDLSDQQTEMEYLIQSQMPVGTINIKLKGQFDYQNLKNIQKLYILVSHDTQQTLVRSRNILKQNVHKSIEIKKEGIYSLYMTFCSTSADYEPNKQTNYDASLRIIEATIQFYNTHHGYLTSENFLKLRLYSALIIFLSIFGVYWIYFALKMLQTSLINIYQLQLLFLFAIALLLYICEYLQYEHINRLGKMNMFIEISINMFKLVRILQISGFTLLLSTGYKVNTLSLSTKTQMKISVLITGLFIVCSVQIGLNQKFSNQEWLVKSFSMFMIALIIGVIYIANQYYFKTLRRLVNYRETFKIRVYRKVKKLANFNLGIMITLSFLLLILRYEYEHFEFKKLFWRFSWLIQISNSQSGGSHSLMIGSGMFDLIFTFDIFFLMIIMCPNHENDKFQYNPEVEFDAYTQERDDMIFNHHDISDENLDDSQGNSQRINQGNIYLNRQNDDVDNDFDDNDREIILMTIKKREKYKIVSKKRVKKVLIFNLKVLK
eukprot:403339630